MASMPNHLAGSTSPYLLQHAENPVDWYPWGPEALEKARREDKPIFLSIGYAACHWCHVMAHESFEDTQTAAFMNAHFVCIKVDREERPDLDGIYMSAVTAMVGQGGWPLSVFLTPDLQPFYGGTYFPPVPRHGLPAFQDLLQGLSHAWSTRRDEISRTGAEVVASLSAEALPTGSAAFEPASFSTARANLMKSYDPEHGGWGPAPKFPQPMAIEFLLRRHLDGDGEALAGALQTLRSMSLGGMHDVLGGGFSRYSTDEFWRVPHFEKMLYDNALLALAYLHAWQVSGEPSFRSVVEATLDFVLRELASPEGGFYSSLDADSEGEEGKYYVWSLEEIRSILGENSALFELAYGLSPAGNWEGRIVLQRTLDDATLAARFNRSVEQVRADLSTCRAALLSVRENRPRPATDDKVLASWNGLMLAAFAEAGRVLESSRYLEAARRNADFLLTGLCSDGRLHHAWRKGQSGREVFLEDYAALILGLLALYQTDFDQRWFSQASELTEKMDQLFSDQTGGFFDTPADASIVLTRPKDLQDSSIPSGNALATEVLLLFYSFTGQEEWRSKAEGSLSLVAKLAPRYPLAFARWLCAADFAFNKVKQVAVIGDPASAPAQALLAQARQGYHPERILAAAPLPLPPGSPPLLADRPMLEGRPTAYVCEGFLCQLPVTTPEELAAQL
jgi:uncharacterized protein YyaL (SSP411 family)